MMLSRSKQPTALVLGGGGAKGAYQIGAWRALKELGFRWDAVVGTSVGTINGALIVQGDMPRAEHIWRSMDPRGIVDLPASMVQDGRISWKFTGFQDFFAFQKSFLGHGGLDTGPLKQLISSELDKGAVRSSGIDFGVVTVDMKKLRPRRLFLSDIPPGHLGDYILASASLPFFEATKIEGVQFADGGLHENVPAITARLRGYRRMVVVDLLGPGNNRSYDGANTDTLWIRLSKPLGGILDFDPRVIADLIDCGYLDTLRTCGYRQGHWYYLRGGERWYRRWRGRILGEPSLGSVANRDLGISAGVADVESTARAVLPENLRLVRDPLALLLECAALTLHVPQLRTYRYDELYAAVREALTALPTARPGSPRHHHWRMIQRDLLPEAETITPRRFLERVVSELPAMVRPGDRPGAALPWIMPAKLFFYLDRHFSPY